MNSFSNQGFSNQSGSHFGTVVSKVYASYSENVENDDGLSQFNHHLTPALREEEVKSYHQVANHNLCDNCSAYSDHIDYLCQENELLHQLVDNLRKRTKESQPHSSHMVRKYESSSSNAKESKQLFANNEVAVKSSVDHIFKQYGAAHEEDKITINRLKSEMDFYKALNQNTESCWRKKMEELTAEKENVIKELQKFIAENAETISRLTKELETAKHSKQDSINQLTSEMFTVKSANQKTIATLTSELDKIKSEKKDGQERVYKLVHELAAAENKAVENQMKVKELNKELARVLKENQETIDKLKEKYNNIEEKDNESQTNLEKLTKDLAATKAQYHLQLSKLSKDIEAMQVSKSESSRSWRK